MNARALVLAFLALSSPATAQPHLYVVESPTHAQTFACGSERHRQWLAWGRDHHLALATEFTNDPYVDQVNFRQYDDFVFQFPAVRLGEDGHTFYYHAPDGRRVAVAERHAALFGVDAVTLLPGSAVLITSPHGFLSLSLLVTSGVVPSAQTASL